MAPASTTLHVLTNARAQPAETAPLSSQPTCPVAARWTLLFGDRQATSPRPVDATLVTIATVTARKLP